MARKVGPYGEEPGSVQAQMNMYPAKVRHRAWKNRKRHRMDQLALEAWANNGFTAADTLDYGEESEDG